MVRVINAIFTAPSGLAARVDAQAELEQLAEAACRRNVAAEHPGFAALTLHQLGIYATPAIYQPELVRVTCFYGYTLIRAPLSA